MAFFTSMNSEIPVVVPTSPYSLEASGSSYFTTSLPSSPLRATNTTTPTPSNPEPDQEDFEPVSLATGKNIQPKATSSTEPVSRPSTKPLQLSSSSFSSVQNTFQGNARHLASMPVRLTRSNSTISEHV